MRVGSQITTNETTEHRADSEPARGESPLREKSNENRRTTREWVPLGGWQIIIGVKAD
jgi:hypothetical protein